MSHEIREIFLVLFFWEVTTIWSEEFDKSRRHTLKPLQSIESHDSQLRKQVATRMLKIGAVIGGNFPHITRTVMYTNVDPNVQFRSTFIKELCRNPKPMTDQLSVFNNRSRDLTGLPSSRLQQHRGGDGGSCRRGKCYFAIPRKVFKEVKRVLVKGGSVVFLEHVGFPNGTWQKLLQSAVTPLWKITCCNCHLNRDSVKEIENAGFLKVTAHYNIADMNVLLRRQACGMAVL
ncbi:thiol S-methyltransferase TMT1A-like [Rhipicephalus microplus]|uniref:thiol S-methyltransferase TMT1A-like n=1 Tax=Rhipicephalus microplus TaxID=6941 RepID=UPI003F6B0C4C